MSKILENKVRIFYSVTSVRVSRARVVFHIFISMYIFVSFAYIFFAFDQSSNRKRGFIYFTPFLIKDRALRKLHDHGYYQADKPSLQ